MSRPSSARRADDTRARILEVATELFIDKGYEATSLREIAERLGFTKAALYYHFQSKDQILFALLEPASELIRELLARLEAADGVEGWAETLDWLIDQMFDHLTFFHLMQRNQLVLENLDLKAAVLPERLNLRDRVEEVVRARGDGLREQVRMVTALAAVTGFDDWAPSLLTGTPPEELQAELRAVVHDLLGVPRHRNRPVARTASAPARSQPRRRPTATR